MNNNFTGLITDEDESDHEQNTARSNQKRVNYDELFTTESESENEPTPSKAKKAKSSDPKPSVAYTKYIKTIQNNKPLLTAVVCASPDEMIMLASQNLQNYSDIYFMEWSECIFIQLCTLKKYVPINSMMWIEVENLIENYQWAIEVVHNIKTYIGNNMTLLSIMERNHQHKITTHKMNPHMMFVSKPVINYKVLKSYKISLDIIMKPLLTNRLPTRFKKIVR